MTTGIERVEEFVGAWNVLDMEKVLGMMTDDIVYHNIPMPVLNGIEAVRGMLGKMKAEQADWTIHAIAERDNVVLTERTDRFLINGKWASVRVMGTFELTPEGKIKAWRDYFDLQEWVSQIS